MTLNKMLKNCNWTIAVKSNYAVDKVPKGLDHRHEFPVQCAGAHLQGEGEEFGYAGAGPMC